MGATVLFCLDPARSEVGWLVRALENGWSGRRDLNSGPLAPKQEISTTYEHHSLKQKTCGGTIWTPNGRQNAGLGRFGLHPDSRISFGSPRCPRTDQSPSGA